MAFSNERIKGCIAALNKGLRDAMALITSVHVSALSAVFAKGILSPSRLPSLLKLNSKRLAEAFLEVVTFFKNSNIQYFPCNSTILICAKLTPLAQSENEEIVALRQYIQTGVIVAPGRAYHINESQKSWMRVLFAVSRELPQEGLKKIESVYRKLLTVI